MNLICFLKGHNFDKECIEHQCICFCVRCKAHDAYGGELPMTIPMWVFLHITWPIKRRYRRWAEWVQPCSDCGRRFGKHDESVQHLPF